MPWRSWSERISHRPQGSRTLTNCPLSSCRIGEHRRWPLVAGGQSVISTETHRSSNWLGDETLGRVAARNSRPPGSAIDENDHSSRSRPTPIAPLVMGREYPSRSTIRGDVPVVWQQNCRIERYVLEWLKCLRGEEAQQRDTPLFSIVRDRRTNHHLESTHSHGHWLDPRRRSAHAPRRSHRGPPSCS